jgi:ribonuclease E
MTKTMLIDATHAEETRVAVVEGNRLVDFDYESKVRKQLKSSIFLAKVTRVEPSLQAAFVNFGGNRHGFLSFSEIHPDYFRIPIADREALLAAQAEELERMAREEEEEERALEGHGDREERDDMSSGHDDESAETEAHDEEADEEENEDVVEVGGEDKPLTEDQEQALAEGKPLAFSVPAPDSEDETDDTPYEDDDMCADSSSEDEEGEGEAVSETENADSSAAESEGQDGGRRRGGRFRRGRGRGRDRDRGGRRRSNLDSSRVEMVGGDGVEGDRPFRFNLRRNYKIQEVVKRGQIMLIQVSKEERGNKGAAVTTYLSLPGRYCVLMPNSPRGGGVSRKIANYADRRKMKEILSELSVPDGMSVILRTAGVTRSKDEIKRDLDYLLRLWDQIREDTLKSSAPALIYEEGNLIKRSIRDLYGRDIVDVHVAGEEGYKTARDFMKMLMPSQEDNIRHYRDRVPLFHKWRVEGQINDIGKTSVTLKSGGYLVINPTEALVSIDVNSGKATKERHIEETALKTNLEAADEVARQLRLRDLGGLIVIDFIDMEDRRNNRKVENRLREALSSDRARIQVGRISSFGLLELSRQRLNPSLSEMQFQVCSHCDGVGRVPTLDFAAIKVIRALEEEGIKGNIGELAVTLPSAVALYILNNKRQMMADIESRYGFKVFIKTDDEAPLASVRIDVLRRGSQNAAAGTDAESDDETESDDSFDRQEGSSSDDASGDPVAEGSGESRPHHHHVRHEHRGGRDEDNRNGRRRGRRGGRNRNRGDRGGEPRGDSQPRSFDDNIDPDTLDQQVNGNVRAPDDDIDDGRMPGNERADATPREGNQQRRDGRGRDRGRRGGRDRNRQDNRQNTHHRRDSHPDGEAGLSARTPAPVKADPAGVPPSEASLRATRPAASNDRSEPAGPKDYEVVNQAPEQKKKGWWSRMTE